MPKKLIPPQATKLAFAPSMRPLVALRRPAVLAAACECAAAGPQAIHTHLIKATSLYLT